jgi:hypothetical protein
MVVAYDVCYVKYVDKKFMLVILTNIGYLIDKECIVCLTKGCELIDFAC